MRIVIAGAAGFIGCHLAERYLQDGHEVVGVDCLVTGSRANVEWLGRHGKYHFIKQDVAEPLDVPGRVDLVCDLACPASPVDFATIGLEILRTCSQGVWNLLELARVKKAVFLHTSTSEVYGDPDVHPQREDYWGRVNPIGPRSVYDEGKRYAEALIVAWHKRHGTPVRLARIFNTYGPRMRLDDGRVVTNFITQALDGKPLTLYGDGSQTRSFCYVSDQVEGLVRLAACDYAGPVNIGNPEEVTVRQLAQEVIELTGSKSHIISTPLPGDDPKQRRPDIALAGKLLNWKPVVGRREGLLKTIEYCIEVGKK
ncbi:MAG: UDP-glucuronic acid decarboxylase family protein [Phycisphaerae bacterium]